MDSQAILIEALKLKPVERLKLMELLSQSLDKPDKEIAKIWAEEAERRYNALRSGKVKTYTISEIVQRYK